jgi:hypothetical protein
MADVQWSSTDQQRADTFERQILAVAGQLRGGHPDVVLVAFAQTTRSLLRQRLRDDPGRAAIYAAMLQELAEEIPASILEALPPESTAH